MFSIGGEIYSGIQEAHYEVQQAFCDFICK
jgi:hypothetical protein